MKRPCRLSRGSYKKTDLDTQPGIEFSPGSFLIPYGSLIVRSPEKDMERIRGYGDPEGEVLRVKR